MDAPNYTAHAVIAQIYGHDAVADLAGSTGRTGAVEGERTVTRKQSVNIEM